MYQETTESINAVETVDRKGEIRKERGLRWAIISFAFIILTIITGVFVTSMLIPSPNKMTAPANSSSAPVQSSNN